MSQPPASFEKRKGTGGIPGQLNEIKLVMLFLLEALEAKTDKKIKQFYLGSNVSAGENFDDVVFKYIKTDDRGKDVYKIILLQAKHKEEWGEITSGQLLSDSNEGKYNLRCYLDSYIKIKQNFKCTKDLILKDTFEACEFVIFTNVGMKFMKDVSVQKLESHEFLNFFQTSPRSIDFRVLSGKENKIAWKKLKVPLDFSKIIEALLESIEKKEMYVSSEIFKKYYSLLTNHVMEMSLNKTECSFRKNFLEGENLEDSLLELRNELLKKLLISRKSSDRKTILDEVSQLKMNIKMKGKIKQNNEEPTLLSTIDDDSITSFLDNLILFFNQLDEIGLEELIKTKIKKRFPGLTDGDCLIVFNNVYVQILDWWKNEKGAVGNEVQIDYLNENNDFFQESQENLVKLRLVSSIMLLQSQIGKFYRYKEVSCISLRKSMLENKIINVVSERETRILTCVKLYQLLEEDTMFRTEKYDLKYIFLTIRSFLVLLESVKECFGGQINMLVIDINESLNSDEEMIFHNELTDILNKNSNKKLILISNENESVTINFPIDKIIRDHEIDFENLDDRSQITLLESKQVLLQGRAVNLDVLQDLNIKEMINAKMLAKLMTGQVIEIGVAPLGLGVVESYFIPRMLTRASKISEDIFRDIVSQRISLKIALSDLTKPGFFINGEKVFDFNFHGDVRGKEQNYDVFILSEGKHEENFNALNSKCIHWLQYKNGSFFWVKSKGPMDELRKYIVTDDIIENQPNEILATENLVIIAAEPGMGKSVLLSSLSLSLINTKIIQTMWIIRLNLNDHSSLLSEMDAKHIDKDVVRNFLIDALRLNDIEKPFFEGFFESGDKIEIFLDSFDEVIDYKDVVCEIIKILKQNVRLIWVTTRLNVSEELENELSIFAFRIVPFSKTDQENFLRLFWNNVLKLNIRDDDDRTNKYIDNILTHFSISINDHLREFIGIPLQLQMIAEDYVETIQKIFDAKEEENFDVTMSPSYKNIFDLYDSFINKKYYKIWCAEKRGVNLTVSSNKYSMDREYVHFKLEHGRIAFITLFSTETASCLFSRRELGDIKKIIKKINEGVDNRGVINRITNEKPVFVHRTFAEFFLAILLADFLENEEDYELIETVLIKINIFSKTNVIVRKFFDFSLAHDQDLLKAVLSNNTDDVINLITNRKNIEFECSDICGRYALHLAASYGCDQIVRSMRRIGNRDAIFKFLPIDYAVRCHHWEVVELLIDDLENQDVLAETLLNEEMNLHKAVTLGHARLAKLMLKKTPADVNVKKIYTPIYFASQYGYLEIASLLIENGADLDSRTEINCTPLYIASLNGHKDMVKLLVKSGANVNVKAVQDSTALYIAAQNGHVEVVEFFIDVGADLNAKTKDMWTPLHVASQMGHLNIVKLLIDSGAELNNETDMKSTPLYLACQQSKQDVAKLLIESGADINIGNDNGSTPIYIASSRGLNDVVKRLIDVGADANTKNNELWTPLHTASMHGHVETQKLLIESGAAIESKSSSGCTPLLTACSEGQVETADFLLGNGADVHSVDNDEWTALHLASREGFRDVVRLLVNRGARVDAVTDDGRTSLDLACRYGHAEAAAVLIDAGAKMGQIVVSDEQLTPLHVAAVNGHAALARLLIERGADLEAKGLESHTPLGLACLRGSANVVEVLLEAGADVAVENANGWTPLHIAASTDSVEAVRFLVKAVRDIDARDALGFTALHIAAAKGGVETTRVLLDDGGANANAVDGEGSTPLHLACLAGHLALVKLLVEAGASVDVEDARGNGPLHAAILSRKRNVAKYLIAIGANVGARDSRGGTPLYAAAQMGDSNLVESLLDGGADVDVEEVNKWTPLNAACHENHLDTVKVLVDRKANLEAENIEKSTPLHTASVRGHSDIVKVLIEKRANVNAEGAENATPLHLASSMGHSKVISVLIDSGANVEAKTVQSQTPLYLACKGEHFEAAKILLDNDAFVDPRVEENLTPLHLVAKEDNLKLTLLLISRGADVEAEDVDQWRPLHFASSNGNVDVVRVLIDQGADVNSKEIDDWTPLYLAAKEGHSDVMRLLLNRGANVHAEAADELTALHMASKNGHEDIANLLLDNGADVNVKEKDKWTPLHFATYNGHLELTGILIERNAKLEAEDAQGFTPLHTASYMGHSNVAQLLIDRGANMEAKSIHGHTSLYLASQQGQSDVVESLVKRNAEVNAEDNEKWTPLMKASQKGNLESVKILIAGGAVVDCKSKNEWTPLHAACQKCHFEVAKFLIDNGAKVNSKSDGRTTPLHLACRKSDLRMVKLLIYKGALVNNKDINGNTPLFTACEEGHLELVEYLIGKDANVRSKSGERCLHVACQRGHLEIVKELIKHGGNFEVKKRTSLLYTAVQCNQSDIVLFFIAKGVNVNDIIRADKKTCLHTACQNGNVDMAKLLIQNGADVNVRMRNNLTPLHIACTKGIWDLADLLLTEGADIEAETNQGCTPLHLTCLNGYLDVAEALLDRGADVGHKNEKNLTPLCMAIENGFRYLVDLLVEKSDK